MGISYKPLFRLLVDKDMTKTDLRSELGFSSATLAKLGKGEPISGAVIEKLCTYFRCQVGDVVEVIWDDAPESVAKSSHRGTKAQGIKNSSHRGTGTRKVMRD